MPMAILCRLAPVIASVAKQSGQRVSIVIVGVWVKHTCFTIIVHFFALAKKRTKENNQRLRPLETRDVGRTKETGMRNSAVAHAFYTNVLNQFYGVTNKKRAQM